MKMVNKETVRGKTVITVERRFLFWSYRTRYEAQREMPQGYWEWLKLPDLTKLRNDGLEFQLDAWNRSTETAP